MKKILSLITAAALMLGSTTAFAQENGAQLAEESEAEFNEESEAQITEETEPELTREATVETYAAGQTKYVGNIKYKELSDGTYEASDVVDRSAPNITIQADINGKKVTRIGDGAFRNSVVRSITIPDSVTYVGESAFYKCTKLTSVTISNSVTHIGEKAFCLCAKLTSVSISNSVTEIGYQAFLGCSSLTSVTIPNSVTSIGGGAFSSTGLTSVTIPDSVTSIGSSAFFDCNSLTSAYIPSSVTSIGEGAFTYCRSLTSINVDDNNSEYCSVDGILFNKSKTMLVQYPAGIKNAEYVVPNSVTSIGAWSFTGCGELTSITIPHSVTSIGNSVFGECEKLASVTIPSGVTEIRFGSFASCSSLTTITIPSSVTQIDSGVFDGCNGLKDVYYIGTLAQWEKISIGSGNTPLLYAILHYNNGFEKLDITITPWCKGGNAFSVPINWSFAQFDKNSNDYNRELSKLGLVLSAYAEESWDKVETLLSQLGYVDLQSLFYGDSVTGDEKIYIPGVTFGHAQVPDGDGHKDYFAIVVRGTTSDADKFTDFVSIIDGLGFSTAGDTIKQIFDEYVKSICGTIPEDIKVFLTGHSLGGVVAGNVAQQLNGDYPSSNIFAYTFAAPKNAFKTIVSSNKNIHNIICPDDWVPKAPLAIPTHYGREWIVENEASSNEFLKKYAELVGKPYDTSNYEKTPWGAAGHSIETYMTHVLLDNRTSRRTSIFSFECPVNVEIYDSDGVLVGRIIDNVIDETVSAENIYLYVDGDHKYFCADGDPDEYTIKLTGTDAGTMKYYVQSIDTTACEVIAEKTFDNVTLEDGKEMISVVSIDNTADYTQIETDIDEVPLYVLDKNGKPEKKVLDDNKGTEVPVNSFTITLNALGGQLNVTSLLTGDDGRIMNKQLPTPARDGFVFDGWYNKADGGEKITADTVFKKDTTLYAHWTSVSTDIIIKVTIPKPAENAPSTGNIKAEIKQDGNTVKTIEIDLNGKTSLGDLANGKYTFTFSADNCAPRTYDVTVTNGTVAGLEDGVELHLIGDINGDGKLTLGDVLKANAAARNSKPLTGYEANVADINNDGKITLGDVLKMNAHARNSKTLW